MCSMLLTYLPSSTDGESLFRYFVGKGREENSLDVCSLSSISPQQAPLDRQQQRGGGGGRGGGLGGFFFFPE